MMKFSYSAVFAMHASSHILNIMNIKMNNIHGNREAKMEKHMKRDLIYVFVQFYSKTDCHASYCLMLSWCKLDTSNC